MKVKMLKTLSGPDGVARRGSEHDFSADEAKRLIESGIAEAVAAPAKKKPAKKTTTKKKAEA